MQACSEFLFVFEYTSSIINIFFMNVPLSVLIDVDA